MVVLDTDAAVANNLTATILHMAYITGYHRSQGSSILLNYSRLVVSSRLRLSHRRQKKIICAQCRNFFVLGLISIVLGLGHRDLYHLYGLGVLRLGYNVLGLKYDSK